MKKNPIIFIAMLIALAFTSCQMNTDDSVVTPPAPTYKITVTATNGTVTLSKTEAKAGETITVTETNPKNGYEFDLGKVTIKDANGNTLSVDATTKSFVMPASNVTITVEFVKITDGGNPTTPTTDGGEDNGTDEPPVTTNEYTVSVASGIKGGHIEVSLDNATWTTLSTSTKYAKNTKLYVRAVADKHYEYKDGLRTDGLEGQLKYIVLNSNAELNANFVIKNESLTPGSLTFGKKYTDVSSYRLKIMVKIAQSEFSESYKDARLAFGFSDGFYGINKRIGSTSTDKYFYVYDTVIPYDTFENVDNSKRIFVAINLDNAYELPDGEIYVLFPNLKNSEEKSVMYKATKDNDGDYVVDLKNYYPKYYFDASQL